MTPLWIIIRGGGDLASGVALRLHRAGLRLLITELAQPLVVRRRVAFAEAVFDGETLVEEVRARRSERLEQASALADAREIPVMVDPDLEILGELRRRSSGLILVDARMTKRAAHVDLGAASLIIGLGPGFIPGLNCHAAVETNRGHYLGRVLWHEPPEADTGLPESVSGIGEQRVLRAPADGRLLPHAEIGDRVHNGQVVAEVNGLPVKTRFSGVLRGLLREGLPVTQGLKIGDVDPRDDPRYCFLVSDKSLAAGGAVLEAILSQPDLRPKLWNGNR